MPVFFFNGPPGHGKTFHATAYVLHALDLQMRVAVSWDVIPPEGVKLIDLRKTDREGSPRKPDLTIAQANEIEGPVLFRFDLLEEIFGLRWCQVFKDEAQNDLGARDWEKMSLRTRIWMSEHRHYGVNLFLYTQHYKFVDVYPRRLGIGNVASIVRLLWLTLEIPRPEADTETGELGKADVFAIKVVSRPFKSLDIAIPIPGFWKLWRVLSKRVPDHYKTHAPHENRLSENAEHPKRPPKTPGGPGPAAALAGARPAKTQSDLPF